MNYYVWTIGCQMNEADSRQLSATLQAMGLNPVSSPDTADLIVINTCVIRQQVEEKIYSRLGMVRELKKKKPDLIAALMGCLVGVKANLHLQERFPFINVFMEPSNPQPLIDYLRHLNALDDLPVPRAAFQQTRPTHVSAYVPVVLGCSHACSFCVIPYRRGPERSRPMEHILAEVRSLVQNGAREITLLGQIVDRYGLDLNEPLGLPALLREINGVEGLDRLRFLTSHPNWFTDPLLESIAELDKVCPYVEIPVQSGNDEVLARMRRGYTAGDYRRLIEKIRRSLPDAAIATDIIVGFPGETESQFMDSSNLLGEIGFDMAHIAKYSERPQTLAAQRFPDDVPPEEKERRRIFLEKQLREILTEKHKPLHGQSVDVLVESRDEQKKRWYGRTPQNKLVFITNGGDLLGQRVQVTVDWAGPFSLVGRVGDRVADDKRADLSAVQ